MISRLSGSDAGAFYSNRTVFALISMALAMCLLSTATHGEVAGQFDFCARPVAPGCVQTMIDRPKKSETDKCKTLVDRYVKAAYAYRGCLNRQLVNEIRKTNRILEQFQCLTSAEKNSKECK